MTAGGRTRGRRSAVAAAAAALAAAFAPGALANETAETPPVDVSIPGEAPIALWGYGEENGPGQWPTLSRAFSACGVGAEQSPIDIRTEAAPVTGLAPIEILWERFTPEVVDTGRTIIVRTNGAGGRAQLDGVDYPLLHFQFRRRSEHLFDGKAAEMEVQFVHRSEAGDYLIVAGLIESGDPNPLLDTLWDLMPDALGSTHGEGPIDPRGLLPLPAIEYRYAGSFTTPPCAETVTWSVRANPLTASEAQIATFAAFYRGNARPVQPVGRRFVLRRE